MKITNCPSCGAQVEFKSSASVMAVCSYCRSTVLRDGATAENIGHLSEILDDFSPIQLGTTGSWQGKPFTVMGRLRLKYENGAWNEWSIEFGDGQQGWLSDASGQYVVTRLMPAASKPPPYEQIKIGMKSTIGGQPYKVTDARTCLCIGGEGELPSLANDGNEFPSVDLRSVGGNGFITLDYSDTPTTVYAGEATTRDALALTHLRSAEEIEAATGKLKGNVQQFDCPACGASLEYHRGFGESVACSYCHAVVALEGERQKVIQKQRELEQRAPELPLGSRGTLRGFHYQVIGFMAQRSNEGDEWEEYLLFAQEEGFLWLIHAEGEWYLTEVLNELPQERGQDLLYAGKRYQPDVEYSATTRYVLGEFNWRVKVGDTTRVTEWYSGDETLSREEYKSEETWSLAKKVPASLIASAFGLPQTAVTVNSAGDERSLPWRWVLTAWLVAFGIDVVAHIAGHGNFMAMLIAGYALWWPRDYLADNEDED